MSSRSVLQNTFLTSAASAFGTGIHGILSAQSNTGLRVVSAGINGGISGATFFTRGIREFAISPLLVATLPIAQYERRRKEGTHAKEDLQWSEIRTDRLLDSGVSGSIAGGILRGVTRNVRAVPSGALSAGVICTLLQYIFNESKIIRLECLLHQRENSAAFDPKMDSSKSWTERLLILIGIKAVSDEEYLTSLKQQRSTHLKRIAELEAEVERQKGGTR